MIGMLRRLGWLTAVALAGIWVGIGFVPTLDSSWMWISRAALFFIGAVVVWFAYPSEEPSERA